MKTFQSQQRFSDLRAWWLRGAMLATSLLLCPHDAAARGAPPSHLSPEATACLDAIKYSETAHKIAPRLLQAIGTVESGRIDPATRQMAPWPWTINIAGTGYVFETKQAAITAVEGAEAAGLHSIDVGCMQVNLLHHPRAFATLEEAFDPQSNARYAAEFLLRLRAMLGNWPAAAAAYHSSTPELGAAYATKVAMFWPEAAAAGLRPPLLLLPDPMARLDPNHVFTAEFRARLAQEAGDRSARLAAMGLLPDPGPLMGGAPRILATPRGAGAGGPRQWQASLRPASGSAWR